MPNWKSISLLLSPAPAALAAERAPCPACCTTGTVVGRAVLRLVFRCPRCGAAFYRPQAPVRGGLKR